MREASGRAVSFLAAPGLRRSAFLREGFLRLSAGDERSRLAMAVFTGTDPPGPRFGAQDGEQVRRAQCPIPSQRYSRTRTITANVPGKCWNLPPRPIRRKRRLRSSPWPKTGKALPSGPSIRSDGQADWPGRLVRSPLNCLLLTRRRSSQPAALEFFRTLLPKPDHERGGGYDDRGEHPGTLPRNKARIRDTVLRTRNLRLRLAE